jgi:hypothetical protein
MKIQIEITDDKDDEQKVMVTTANQWRGLSAQDKETIMMVSGSPSQAMLYTEDVLRKNNGG